MRTRVLLTMLQLGLFASPLLAQAEAKRPTARQKEIRSVYQQLLRAITAGHDYAKAHLALDTLLCPLAVTRSSHARSG